MGCPSRFLPITPKDLYKKLKHYLLTSVLSGKLLDLTWLFKGPKFNLHHLLEISVVFPMAVLTPKFCIFD